MEKEELVKYSIWILFFILALAGLYFALKSIGIMK